MMHFQTEMLVLNFGFWHFIRRGRLLEVVIFIYLYLFNTHILKHQISDTDTSMVKLK